MSALSDADLLAGVVARDPSVWPVLVGRYVSWLWAIARGVGLNRDAAEDVVQNTWIILMDKCASINDGDALRGWLRTVTRNEAIRVSKLSGRSVPTEPDDFMAIGAADDGPDVEALRLATAAELEAAISTLVDHYAELVRLRFLGGLAYHEIAEVMERPEGWVGPSLGRALQQMRVRLSRG